MVDRISLGGCDRQRANGAATGLATTHWHSTIERTVTGLDYELVDVERSAAGLLRVTIDRIPGRSYPGGEADSVTVEDCERVTRQLQYVLEVEAVPYQRLEVSSPGLDRPLKRPADYARFAGHEVELTLKEPFNGRKNFRGTLLAADEGWRLALAGDKAEQALDFNLDEVRAARLVPVLNFKGRARGVDGGQTR
jgi:ribosome maturation factor RimP